MGPDEKVPPEYSTAEFRKNMKVALGNVYHTGCVIRVSNHGKPYVGVVSEKAAQVVEAMKKVEAPSDEDIEALISLLDGKPKRLEELLEEFKKRIQKHDLDDEGNEKDKLE